MTTIRGHDDGEPGADHHADEHDVGHGDGHGDEGEPLGPVDVPAWGMAALGVLMGLAVAGALFVAGSA
jgi:hypothetical protein